MPRQTGGLKKQANERDERERRRRKAAIPVVLLYLGGTGGTPSKLPTEHEVAPPRGKPH